MRSFIAALRTLVLPYGATSGQRIVLDGVNGVISIFDTGNVLRARISPAGVFEVFKAADPINPVAHMDQGGMRLNGTSLGIQVTSGGGITVQGATSSDDLSVEHDILVGTVPKSLPRGLVVAPAKITSNFASGGAAEADVTGLSVTWTAISTRQYRLVAHSRGIALTVAGRARMAITDSANTHVAECDKDCPVAAIAYGPATCSTILTGLSGSQTYKVRCSTLAGGGNWTLAGTPEAYLSVEDLGAP